MSLEASIDVQFAQTYLPKDIINNLINNNWKPCYKNKVHFLFPSDDSDSDWKEKECQHFDLERFLNSHAPNDKIGLVMTKDDIGVHILVYPKWMTITLSINRIDLDSEKKLPNFSWYLNILNPFLKKVNILGLQCELVY